MDAVAARAKLIEKLTKELDMAAEISINEKFTITSPEVQEVPMFSLRLNVGETRLIRDVLTSYHNQRNM